jgi:hypothetical protein
VAEPFHRQILCALAIGLDKISLLDLNAADLEDTDQSAKVQPSLEEGLDGAAFAAGGVAAM